MCSGADITVTRQWMRVILWRLSASRGHFALTSSNRDGYQDNPIEIARESFLWPPTYPKPPFEAHGPGLVSFSRSLAVRIVQTAHSVTQELKVFEIASSVVDAVKLRAPALQVSEVNDQQLPSDILKQLRKFLSRNKKLDELLRVKIAKLDQDQQLSLV